MGNNMEIDYEMFCYQYAEKLPKSQICRIF